ncbi:hypothetical protein [uncultured Methylovirgula sp.]|uniref:hypothetical protein n=1 Tax=uncultured Methylovirgula sp. TaxID=1285960 RepID=UPI00261A4021|nr:hypothetical protein [uncultured Methylovirgula sp.]
MKILTTALITSALAFAGAPVQAATHYVHHHHVHVVHHYYHHHYYYAGGGVSYYPGAPGYGPPPAYPPYYGPNYYGPGVYAPGYFYFAPGEYLGNRNTLKALIDSEWDPPFSGR